MDKKSFIVICLIAIGFISLIAFCIKRDNDKNTLNEKIINNYQGSPILNGVQLDSNCSIEDPVVIKITEYIDALEIGTSVLIQVAEPSKDDEFHQFLSLNLTDYDGHTYWRYKDGYMTLLFYEVNGEPKFTRVYR